MAVASQSVSREHLRSPSPSECRAALRAVRRNGLALETVPAALQRNRRIVIHAVISAGSALKFAPPSYQADEFVVALAVRSDGMALQYAAPVLRAHRPLVLAAVTHTGLALQFADPSLKKDLDVVRIAVHQDSTLIYILWLSFLLFIAYASFAPHAFVLALGVHSPVTCAFLPHVCMCSVPFVPFIFSAAAVLLYASRCSRSCFFSSTFLALHRRHPPP